MLEVSPAAQDTTVAATKRWRLPRQVVIVTLMSCLAVSACSSDTRSGISDAIEDGGVTLPEGEATVPDVSAPEPEETVPEETVPEETVPDEGETVPEEPAAPEEETDEGITSQQWLLIAILGFIGIGAIVAIANMMSGRSQSKNTASGARQAQLADLIGGSQWVLDQGSMEALRISDPAQLTHSWQDTRARIVDLESRTASMAVNSTDGQFNQAIGTLGQSAAGLRVALDSYVSLRTDPTATDRTDLVQASTQTVQQRRLEMQSALTQVQSMR